jgi:hypothetical protein
MWANASGHSDSTWPWSQELLKQHRADLTEKQAKAILGGNVAEFHGIDATPPQ